MRKFFSHYETLLVLAGAIVVTIILFRGYFFQNKILFPSNLLVSTYAPWKYEPDPEYPNGPPNKPMGFDNVRQFFPNRIMVKHALLAGVIPLWNPYIYSGTPFMAAFDTAIWYPFSLIAALLPAVEGWNFLVIIQPICTFFFMYVFLKSMKFRSSIAAYGALAYGLSGWMVVYWQEILVLEHSFLWLPLALYASNRLWENKFRAVDYLLLVAALSFSIFGGFLQTAIYVYGVVVLWNAYLSFVQRKINIRILSAVIFSILIASIQLLPSIEAFISSPRGAAGGFDTFSRNLLPFQHLITLIAPDFWGSPATYNYFGGGGFYFEKMIFIGVLPLLFSVYAMFDAKKKIISFFTILALVALSMGFALPSSWLPYSLHIPVLSNSYPTRIFGVFAFSMVTLSCFGLSSFLELPNRKRLVRVLLGISILLVSGWVVVAVAWSVRHNIRLDIFWKYISILKNDSISYSTVSLRNLIIPTVFVLMGWILVAGSKYFRQLVYMFVFLCTLASGLYFAQKYVYFSERRFVYPDLPVISKISSIARYDRVWGYGNAYLEKNLPQYFRWFSTDGYGNLSSRRYGELLSTIANNGKLGGMIRRSDTDLYEASEWDRFGSVNPYRLRMMSLFGVKYVLEAKKGELKEKRPTEERFPPSDFMLVWEDPAWRIWEYLSVLPRATFATRYLVRTDPQEIIDTLYDPSVDLGNTVILEEEPGVTPSTMTVSTGSAVITSYGLNSVVLSSTSPVDGFVVLSDTYDPGWTATVDGKPADVYRADFAIRAVAVPGGEHTVEFTYKPESVYAGGVVSLFGVLLTVCGALYLRQSRGLTRKER